MDQSRRAVEAYWRSRLIEGATADEDKVAPVYKLEEICELLRSSHVSIVKEVSEYVLKRLNHKSPIVKQKTLRLIKYCVGKSGVEFRREMQRHSAAVRQLFHYKGQVDPLKGDALNKAVRDTAHEAISAIFASEDDKPSPAEDLNRRIEGFGNTNFEAPSEDKKSSFLSDFVDLGSASIKLGLSSITAAHSSRKNDSGTYRGPVLRRSLTTEMDPPDRYERFDNHNEARGSSGISKNVAGGTWGNESRVNATEITNGESSSAHAATKSREERLLETIITSGGVRLQPSRDALQVFLVEAYKLDSVALSCALELKLQSHLWQVRMKAICVLEALLRKKDDAHFGIVASYFSENKDAVVKCSESPQASLREKAIKVLNFLNEEQISGEMNLSEKSSAKLDKAAVVQMPDLIDTGDSDEYYVTQDAANKQSEQNVTNLMKSTRPPIDDLFGDSSVTDIGTNGNQNDEDPFADVSFHSNDDKTPVDDLFSGLTVDDRQPENNSHLPANSNSQELLDIFGTSFESPQEPIVNKTSMQDLVGGYSDNEKSQNIKNPVLFAGPLHGAASDSSARLNNQVSDSSLNDMFSSQMTGMNQNPMFHLGPMQYNVPPNVMFNQALASQQVNYGAMGSFLAQQQLLATMSNFQNIGNQSAHANSVVSHLSGNQTAGALPDIFNPNIAVQTPNTMLNNTKKEETRAFDFISEHLSAVRDPKRVV